MVTVIFKIGFYGIAVINAIKIGFGMVENDLRKTPDTSTYFQYIFIFQVFFIPAGNGKKTVITELCIFLFPINLCGSKLVPLIAKILGIVIIFNKPVCPVFKGKTRALFSANPSACSSKTYCVKGLTKSICCFM